MNTQEHIKNILSKVLHTEVNDSTSQANCAEWDSLHHLNMIVELEMTFDVSFEPEEMAAMKSVKDIGDMIAKKQSE